MATTATSGFTPSRALNRKPGFHDLNAAFNLDSDGSSTLVNSSDDGSTVDSESSRSRSSASSTTALLDQNIFLSDVQDPGMAIGLVRASRISKPHGHPDRRGVINGYSCFGTHGAHRAVGDGDAFSPDDIARQAHRATTLRVLHGFPYDMGAGDPPRQPSSADLKTTDNKKADDSTAQAAPIGRGGIRAFSRLKSTLRDIFSHHPSKTITPYNPGTALSTPSPLATYARTFHPDNFLAYLFAIQPVHADGMRVRQPDSVGWRSTTRERLERVMRDLRDGTLVIGEVSRVQAESQGGLGEVGRTEFVVDLLEGMLGRVD